MSGLAPFRLEPICLAKVWAAPELPQPWGSLFNAPADTGEIWLAADRHHVTRVVSGPLAGQGLDQVMDRHAEDILGPGGRPPFPLLLKILNVGQWLSVQVHPDDQTAQRLEGEPWGKSEAWHVLDTERGAEIIMGLQPGVDQEAVCRAVAAGELPGLLARVPAGLAQTFHLPAGTVHATGPGLTILELQQASDVTYRFYDWDRPGDDGRPRELHQEKALAAMCLAGPGGPTEPVELSPGPNRVLSLVSGPYFELRRSGLRQDYRPDWADKGARLIFVSQGHGVAEPHGVEMGPGQTWLFPAQGPQTTIRPHSQMVLFEALAPAL